MDWAGQTALVRVDFNVPMKDGGVEDDTRIRAALPTIDYLRDLKAKVVLLSHLGRPDGEPSPKYSLQPVAETLAALLNVPVPLAPDCIGPEAEMSVMQLQVGGVALLQNVRFHPQEECNDPAFAERLASLGTVFVNDAFGTAHRAHASTEGIARFLPAVAGLLMEKEIAALTAALDHPEPPFVSIVGGAKVSTKLAVLENLLPRVNALLIGGGMANTFLRARGYEVGKSLFEPDLLEMARDLLLRAGLQQVDLVLPTDVVVTTKFEGGGEQRIADVRDIHPEEMVMDIGPRTIAVYESIISQARTVLWNGPMGVFEQPSFAHGTLAVARALSASNGTTVVGGGESVQAVEQAGVASQLTHVSTGGGASLEFIEGKVLPGVAALKRDCS